MIDRRTMLVQGLCSALVGSLAGGSATAARTGDAGANQLAPYRTPFKYPDLILAGSGVPGAFDEKSVDCPFVFWANDRFYLTYVGFDGKGYQTGICESRDLVKWKRRGVILARDPDDPVIRHNIAAASILRENELNSVGRLIKVGGRYVSVWHSYPNEGYEIGAAVIGIAFSDDLFNWEIGPVILRPEDGAEWERGGLYKPYITLIGDTFHLYYNAKTEGTPWIEQTGLATSKDLKEWTRNPANPVLAVGGKGEPDEWFASDPVVVSHAGKWAMLYFGRAKDGKCRDLIAIGDTPDHFVKQAEVLIDVGRPGSIDEKFAHKPSVVHFNGALYHFYCAVSGQWPNDTRGLAVARSQPWISL